MDSTAQTAPVDRQGPVLRPREQWHAIRSVPAEDRLELLHPAICRGRLDSCTEAVDLDKAEDGVKITHLVQESPDWHLTGKAREDNLRRKASQRLLRLRKSQARSGPTVGTYWLLNFRNGVVYGDTINGYGMTLDQIEAYLTEDAAES